MEFALVDDIKICILQGSVEEHQVEFTVYSLIPNILQNNYYYYYNYYILTNKRTRREKRDFWLQKQSYTTTTQGARRLRKRLAEPDNINFIQEH